VGHVKASVPARSVVREALRNLEKNRANLLALQREVQAHGADPLDFHMLTRLFEADSGCLPARKPLEG
jgi:hypothetical protein